MDTTTQSMFSYQSSKHLPNDTREGTPGVGDYYIKREFDVNPIQEHAGARLLRHKSKANKAWTHIAKSCEKYRIHRGTPGPGDYVGQIDTFVPRGASFSKEMRVWDKMSYQDMKAGF